MSSLCILTTHLSHLPSGSPRRSICAKSRTERLSVCRPPQALQCNEYFTAGAFQHKLSPIYVSNQKCLLGSTLHVVGLDCSTGYCISLSTPQRRRCISCRAHRIPPSTTHLPTESGSSVASSVALATGDRISRQALKVVVRTTISVIACSVFSPGPSSPRRHIRFANEPVR